ncbi:disease resistance-responsive (dirigent-likeprotein) family protein [Striga asiatica]|uniref:Dirigent protein n=1 Tax=Striga asiatica TaxID=4170 RepID=A0A5A7Q8Y7_STRAF|nr:disease resistance-responsive (dirigent-likeprotein) family protein [Striga asiatica]
MIMPEANGFGKKFTQLQLYVQDMLHGPTPTPINVAMANSTPSSPTFFGLVAVLDDPVRTGLSLDAEIVGRAQGMIVFASIAETNIHLTFDLVFTGGEYNEVTLGASFSQVLSEEDYVSSQKTQSQRARHQPPANIGGGRRRRDHERQQRPFEVEHVCVAGNTWQVVQDDWTGLLFKGDKSRANDKRSLLALQLQLVHSSRSANRFMTRGLQELKANETNNMNVDVGKKLTNMYKKFDPNQSSKRKVRSGSDPIHNRS